MTKIKWGWEVIGGYQTTNIEGVRRTKVIRDG